MAVIPWFPYSRQDRKAKPREPISGRLVADMLQLAGADRVLTMDLHAGQVQGFFTIPVDHMTALPLFAQHFRDLGLTGEKIVSVAPDAGRAKYALRFAEMISADFHDHAQDEAGSRRGRDHRSHRRGPRQDRDRGRRRHDDRRDADRERDDAQEHGATEVWMFVTHSLLDAEALQRLAAADIKGIVVTDTVPIDPVHRPPNLTVLTVSGLLAETIMNVFADESVSAIFGSENQLF